MSAERTPEEKLRIKRLNAVIMMILGAIMAAAALAAGLIALSPGTFPRWMTGAWRTERALKRGPTLVRFEPWSANALSRAAREHKLVLLHLAPKGDAESALMLETTYADPEIAAWIEEHAVPVTADPAKKPGLGRRYGVGAWPSTVLILPDGRAVASAARLTPGLFLPWARLIDERVRADPEKADALARYDAALRAARRKPAR